MTTRRYRPDTPGSDFRLPPNITVTRQYLANGIAYVFRDFWASLEGWQWEARDGRSMHNQ
jgi:hypothetical protein